jgi:AcrR family transcriptional regulator
VDHEPTDRSPRQRAQRSDAQRNYRHILETAHTVVEEEGTQASLRDIARRAGVGLGTLYRHFPTRDALLEALLCQGFDHLAASAVALVESDDSLAALREWLGAFLGGATAYRGLATSMMASLRDQRSPLYASCATMHEAAAGLLHRAQEKGQVRSDVTGTDLFAVVNALAWITEQVPDVATRRDHLFAVFFDGLAPCAAHSATRTPSKSSTSKNQKEKP